MGAGEALPMQLCLGGARPLRDLVARKELIRVGR
jgi:hypothetical protein